MRYAWFVAAAMLCAVCSSLPAQSREKLDRGLVAVRAGEGKVYLSWRLLPNDPPRTGFSVFRRVGGGQQVELNRGPIVKTTDFLDDSAPTDKELTYSVRPSGPGQTPGPTGETTLKPGQGEGCLVLPLQGPYRFQKFAPADLDGDGRLDYVIKQPNDNVDPWYKYWKKSTDTYKLEAYRADGTHLWTYDMGWAIERGIWYSPYVVWDLDGDGKAEVVCKGGEGDPRDAEGKVQSGPEYILVLSGTTGKEIARANWPARELFASQGQHAYNYASRNQLAVACLDGQKPSLIVNRGTYNLIVIEAYDLREGKLVPRWKWSNEKLDRGLYWGQGAHWMHAADVDGDGKDEVLFGSACLDDDGKEMWSTGLGHPDHLYVGDLDPKRPGLEIYYGIERKQAKANGMCMVDARTGKILWGHQGATRHVHSHGMCSDIDGDHPGSECYSADTDEKKQAAWARLHSSDGKVLSKEMPWKFGPRVAYWDADPQRELVTGGNSGGQVAKYKASSKLIQYQGNVVAVADILGDWREELITSRDGEMRIYVSTIPATDRRVTLLADALYRMDTVVGAMGYYQVPMLSYDMAAKTGNRE